MCIDVYPLTPAGAGERVRKIIVELEPLFCQTASLGSHFAWKAVPLGFHS